MSGTEAPTKFDWDSSAEEVAELVFNKRLKDRPSSPKDSGKIIEEAFEGLIALRSKERRPGQSTPVLNIDSFRALGRPRKRDLKVPLQFLLRTPKDDSGTLYFRMRKGDQFLPALLLGLYAIKTETNLVEYSLRKPQNNIIAKRAILMNLAVETVTELAAEAARTGEKPTIDSAFAAFKIKVAPGAGAGAAAAETAPAPAAQAPAQSLSKLLKPLFKALTPLNDYVNTLSDADFLAQAGDKISRLEYSVQLLSRYATMCLGRFNHDGILEIPEPKALIEIIRADPLNPDSQKFKDAQYIRSVMMSVHTHAERILAANRPHLTAANFVQGHDRSLIESVWACLSSFLSKTPLGSSALPLPDLATFNACFDARIYGLSSQVDEFEVFEMQAMFTPKESLVAAARERARAVEASAAADDMAPPSAKRLKTRSDTAPPAGDSDIRLVSKGLVAEGKKFASQLDALVFLGGGVADLSGLEDDHEDVPLNF